MARPCAGRPGGLTLAAVALLVVATVPQLTAQAASDLLERGVRAYQALEYDTAVTYLRASIGGWLPAALPDSQRARALAYLGATELFQGSRDSAAVAFRALVRLDPRYRPDELIFPPQVTNFFEDVRRSTKVLVVAVPPETELQAGRGWLIARVIASPALSVTVGLARPDGTPVRELYEGPVAESLLVKWDGLTGEGAVPEAGRYVMRVTPHPATDDRPRALEVPLDLTHVVRDTLLWPVEPAPLLPERTAAMPALGLFGAVALAGGTIVALPALSGHSADATGARFVVAAAVGIAGIVGVVARHPRPIEANLRANARTRAEWQRRLQGVQGENAKARAGMGLRIHAGPVVVADRGAP